MENHHTNDNHHEKEVAAHAAPATQPGTPAWFLPASILAAAVLISASLIYMVHGGAGSAAPAADVPQEEESMTVEAPGPADRDVILGNADAPVSIVVYADFQCPYCVSFFDETEKQLRTAYVETGKAKIAYRHFPLTQIHPAAVPAAEASECAKDQGKFWEFHDALYTSETSAVQETTLNAALYSKIASDLGLDTGKFASCVSARTHKDFVAAQASEATAKYGVNSTPTIFVNDQKVEGAYPFSTFQEIIEGQL